MTLVRTVRTAFKSGYTLEQFFSVDPPSLTEGNSGNKTFTFTLNANRTFPYDVLFDYQTQENGGANAATEGVDYEATSGTGTLTAGQTQATVDVPVIGDTDVEADELFRMRFSNFRAA